LAAEKIVTWLHPSGHIGYVIYNDGNGFFGLMLERFTDKSASDKAAMCAWCMSVKLARQMALFSKKISENSSKGVTLCADLDCLHSVQNPGPHAMCETISAEEKRQRYYNNVGNYIRNFNV